MVDKDSMIWFGVFFNNKTVRSGALKCESVVIKLI